MNIIELLKDHMLILDGGMGTEILKRLDQKVDFFERLNLENRGILVDIHKEYIQAGADIITTNTFGANRIKLANFGAEHKIKSINAAALDAAVKARGGRDIYIAGSYSRRANRHPGSQSKYLPACFNFCVISTGRRTHGDRFRS